MNAENTEWTRTSLSIDPAILEIGKTNAARRGFRHSFSAYVSWLIERDRHGAVEGGRLDAPQKNEPAPSASKAPKNTVRDMARRAAAKAKAAADARASSAQPRVR